MLWRVRIEKIGLENKVFPDRKTMSLLRISFHPLGFTFAVVMAPLFAYMFDLPVAQHVAKVSLSAIAVLLGNIVNELRKG